jgi:hypothetical protein
MEKRVDRRHNCKVAVICNFFNKDKTFTAEMLNYSEGGIYFESDSFFEKGTNIFFKVKTCSSGTYGPGLGNGLRTVSLAEVRWWQEMSSEDSSRFGMGVKYY